MLIWALAAKRVGTLLAGARGVQTPEQIATALKASHH
jgi:hypothetical protein